MFPRWTTFQSFAEIFELALSHSFVPYENKPIFYSSYFLITFVPELPVRSRLPDFISSWIMSEFKSCEGVKIGLLGSHLF